MKLSMYPKLAIDSVRKNKRLYIPYILTCVGMVMMYYIISFLAFGKSLDVLKGGSIMQQALRFGCGVLGVFSLIFLFYTNSFLIKRRKKEFGLYNILGMGKVNIALMLICESLIIAAIAIVIGLVFGVMFSKLAELLMINIMHAEANFTFSIEWLVVAQTALIFLGIFALLLVNTLRQIHLSQPIELLRSDNAGEKQPKANWLMAVAGVVILIAAYIIAITIKNPIQAMVMFFIAVIMVIIATYLLFISGSVAACKMLKNNKKYYYKTNHFVSVSSMIYRMKRNGAGLASICILCTMVLVMTSSTVCLYAGAENSLQERYPRQIDVTFRADKSEYLKTEEADRIKKYALKTVADRSLTPQNEMDFTVATFLGTIENDKINVATEYELNTVEIQVISLTYYNTMMNKYESLKSDEVMIYTNRDLKYHQDTITIEKGTTYKIKKTVDEFTETADATMQTMQSLYIIAPSIEEVVESAETTATFGGDKAIFYANYFGFDLDCDEKEQIEIANKISKYRDKITDKDDVKVRTSIECRASEKVNFYDLYGSLFFLGILLGIVFVFAAVLIIYYKQISEGYEDQSRFEIMQNVGMSKKEIKKSINSQVLTVFFLPLIMSAVHLAFAFPMIYRLLMLFSITNLPLLIGTTVGCFAIFSLFYIIVYRATSKTYYSIVS
ncbi:MAG: FtsX-like permease family protein [Faecalibacterium sp.]|nr:FtsX-like permease family protein [Ruminococcus sp.]MCM1392957.1 FtsX-like permease family protein [Ruminococcus sp.]MCM1485310.1 FtsX-like permease family protein [Faecalibacterium sp.]